MDLEQHGPIKQFFNENTGLGFETIEGPYKTKGTMGVFGIKADAAQLEKFLEEYLTSTVKGSDISFELTGDTVFLLFNDFDSVKGAQNHGIYRNQSVHFHVPVVATIPEAICRHRRINGQRSEKAGTVRVNGSIQVFSFGTIMLNVITSNEVRGPAMRHADMLADGVWLEDLHPASPPRVLVDIRSELPRESGGEVTKHSMLILRNKADGESEKTFTDWARPPTGTLDKAIDEFLDQQSQVKTLLQKLTSVQLNSKTKNAQITRIMQGAGRAIASTWKLKTALEENRPLLGHAIGRLIENSDFLDLVNWFEEDDNRATIVGLAAAVSEDQQAQPATASGFQFPIVDGQMQRTQAKQTQQGKEQTGIDMITAMFASLVQFVSDQVLDWQVADVLTVFALKQFPHEADPTRACYQSLVMIDHSISYTDAKDRVPGFLKWLNIFWQSDPQWDLSLPVNRNDGRLEQARIDIQQDICDSLGLVSESLEDADLRRCQPVIYARVSTGTADDNLEFTEALGKTLSYRYSTRDEDGTPGTTRGWRR